MPDIHAQPFTPSASRRPDVVLLHAKKRGRRIARAAVRGLDLLGFAVRTTASVGSIPSTHVVIACDRVSAEALAARPIGAAGPAFSFVATPDLPALPAPAPADGTLLDLLTSLAPTVDALDGLEGPPPGDEDDDRSADVTVIVPVHGALDELERCVRSVVASSDDVDVRVLVVDDGSPQPDAAERLAAVAALDPRVDLLTRPDNRGYTATVNEGCRAATGDVVLLNSDTEVAEGWLSRLRAVAYARPAVATVTPVSNAAGPFSVPVRGGDDLAPGTDVATMDALVRRLSPKRRPATPTGHGFCMYVRRAAFDAVGYFDELAFPRGYGEENDFCMRASAAGMIHLVDDATFVYHQRSASFGAEKAAILQASRLRLDAMHPTYTEDVRSWSRRDVLEGLRTDVGRAIAGGPDAVEAVLEAPPAILFVLHDGGGGTPQTNADLMGSLAGRFRPVLLRCGLREWTLVDAEGQEQRTWSFGTRWDARAGADPERTEALRDAIEAAGAAIVHVRSLIASGPEYLEVVKASGRPLVLSFHDFAAVCPTIQLLDEQHRYCGGFCTPGPGSCALALFWFERAWADLKHDYVHEWRRRMAEGFEHVDAFVTTSEASRDVLTDHFARIDERLRIIDHGRDTGRYRRIAAPPAPGGPQRVVTFGALGYPKGIGLLEEVMKLDQERGPRFEFHFVGQLHGRWHPEQWGGVVHGPYERGSLDDALAGIAPSYAIVASLWPETYCHTLTEAWACGLPVFASDIGTLRERVRATRAGWLLDQTDPAAWYRGMCAAADDRRQWDARIAAIDAAPARTIDDMALGYAELYADLLAGSVAPDRAGAVRA